MVRFVTNLDLYCFLKRNGDLKDFSRLNQAIVSDIPGDISEEDQKKIKEFTRLFTKDLAKKWADANRCEKTFLNRENIRKWLESPIKWPVCDSVDLRTVFAVTEDTDDEPNLAQVSEVSVPSCSTADVGTSTQTVRRVPFQDLSNKQKKRRSDSILDENSEEELAYFFTRKLKDNGKQSLAKIIEYLIRNEDRITDVSNLLFKQDNLVTIAADKCLALYTSLALSKWQYLAMRLVLQEEKCAAFPSYQMLLCAKKKCYPPQESIEIRENGARIRLQALLDHTVQRILLDLGPIFALTNNGLKLVWKWGLDGSSSQANYKQRFSTPAFDESTVVMTSIVPLRLIDSNDLIIWENPTPCSTHYCRPVKFTFTSETAEFITADTSEMEREIAELVPTQCGNAEIIHELHMTMIDGKVVNILADVRSSATCPICLAKPSEMNNLGLLATKTITGDIYRYGISSLHMKIRCMECLLHISYNMDFERWSARGENKALKQAKKDATQQEFREQTGLLIDIVKQGFGTTNDGNTARSFFTDYKKSAEITGIDENLIFRFSVILQAVSSGSMINTEKFADYCKETAELYVHLYPWYYMPTSVHKLLLHGAEICRHFSTLPIGILSEEASEARNKDFRNIREKHTRKIGRLQINQDFVHGLLISSDPHISRIRPKFFKASNSQLFPEALQLLQIASLDDNVEEQETMIVECEENIQDPLQ